MRRDAIRLAVIFGITAIVLICSTAVSYWFGQHALNATAELVRIQFETHAIDDMLSTLKDAETGQRGYLITGEERYLAPYQSALNHYRDEIAQLSTISTTDPVAAARRAKIDELVAQKLAELARTIELRRARGMDAAMDAVRSGTGIALMDQIRAETAAWLNDINSQQREVAARSVASTNLRNAIFLACLLLNLGFIAWVYVRVSREIDRSDLAAADAREQKTLYATTLASIGDAVLTTDHHGRITFINAVAEKLSGWNRDEVVGKPCSDVFVIVNETSREKVESPVDQVLRTGKIVALANHTVLIRKDGSEVPIDDSGAPIRLLRAGQEERIDGVVLVFRDFTERARKEQALRHARHEAEQANRAKDQFLASLSHELRTPLTPVLATLSIWETAHAELPENLRDDVQLMRRNVELEARLIDDLLDLTRVARGKLSLAREHLDLHDILHHVIKICGSDLNGKRIKIERRFEAERFRVHADPARLHQVFWNILRNAAKFSPADSTVTIQTICDDSKDGQITVRVIDRGIGMNGEVLGRLFRPFEQGDDDILRRFGGLGLGMAISKALVDVHGGTISAHSDGAGAGSTFTVCLPTLTGADADDATPPRRIVTDLRPLTILLVEDHEDTAKTMSRLIVDWGHQVETAATVAMALNLARGKTYDLLISDLGLPDGTGNDLLREIRSFSKIPAIALTGFGMDDDIARTKAAGFAAHVTKPVNIKRLELLMQQLTSFDSSTPK